jgi:pimeloyl-ACP methyl ester carboxylesterase
MRCLAVLLFAASLLPAATAARERPAARDPAVTDPAPDRAFPTANRQLLVPSGDVGMNALFLLAAGEAPKPTLVLLHGLPGNERNFDLAQAVRRAGWNVLTFTYRGAWGSPGRFSIAGALEDTAAAVAYLRRPEVAAKYRVDRARIVLGGHSMGGFAAAKYAAAHDDIAALLLIDAWNVGADARGFRGDAAKRAAFVAGWDDLGHALVGADAESIARETERSGADWDLLTLAPRLAARPVLTIWAERGIAEDNRTLARAIRAAGAKRLATAHFPTDHAFSDHRIALAREVIAWLDSLRLQRP